MDFKAKMDRMLCKGWAGETKRPVLSHHTGLKTFHWVWFSRCWIGNVGLPSSFLSARHSCLFLISENTPKFGGFCFQYTHYTPQPFEFTWNTDILKNTQSFTEDKFSITYTHASKHTEFMRRGYFVRAVTHFQDQEHKTQETKRR